MVYSTEGKTTSKEGSDWKYKMFNKMQIISCGRNDDNRRKKYI